MNCENKIESMYSDELFRAVGILFVTAAYSENTLTFQLARLISHPDDTRTNEMMALHGMETKVKLEKIVVAAHLHQPERTPDIRKACDKIRSSFQRRNEIAHLMDAGQKPDALHLKLLKFRSDGTLAKDKVYTAAQIRVFAATLLARMQKLDQLINDLGVKKVTKQQ